MSFSFYFIPPPPKKKKDKTKLEPTNAMWSALNPGFFSVSREMLYYYWLKLNYLPTSLFLGILFLGFLAYPVSPTPKYLSKYNSKLSLRSVFECHILFRFILLIYLVM